jgi:hypothetical protein
MIGCEVQSHDAYGTPRKLFGEFFGVIADTQGRHAAPCNTTRTRGWQRREYTTASSMGDCKNISFRP